MATAVEAPPLMTTEDFLALPDDGVERWLINGRLVELPMTVRNRLHTKTAARVTKLLGNWCDGRPAPRGEVHVGEAGCRLRKDPDTTVGIDIAYASPEMVASQADETTLLDGIPTLVVEILSPSDMVESIKKKVRLYIDSGVPVVWVLDPYDRTVTVHRPHRQPQSFNCDQEISGEPELPGFRAPVASLF